MKFICYRCYQYLLQRTDIYCFIVWFLLLHRYV